ncbi:MAG: hypothetical protein RLZZ301_1401 [Bacteroidota bacterium]|jgi:hypothetical protein
MRHALLIFIFGCAHQIFAQQVTLDACPLHVNYISWVERNNPHYSDSYTPGNGYAIQLSIQDPGKRLKAAQLAFETYTGYSYIKDGGLGGSFTTSASFKKSTLQANVFPLQFQSKIGFYGALGAGLSILLHEQVDGEYGSFSYTQPYGYTATPFNKDFNQTFGAQLCTQFGFRHSFYKQWGFQLAYQASFGLLTENTNAHAIKQKACVGLYLQL